MMYTWQYKRGRKMELFGPSSKNSIPKILKLGDADANASYNEEAIVKPYGQTCPQMYKQMKAIIWNTSNRAKKEMGEKQRLREERKCEEEVEETDTD